MAKLNDRFNISSLRCESFIGGRYHRSCQSDYLDVLSPIDGRALYKIPEGNAEQIDMALIAAEKAFKKWSTYTADLRAEVLNNIAGIINKNKSLLALMEVYDTGKLFKHAIQEIELASEYFQYFAACVLTQEGGVSSVQGVLSINLYEPLGMVGVILPWNFPTLMFCWKVAAIIASGNTVVVKPSEYGALSIIKLMSLIGVVIPKGVINVVFGSGAITGSKMLEHPGFDKFSFTGSVLTSKTVLKIAARQLTPVSLELGGKSPCIVCEDALDHGAVYLDKLLQTLSSFTYHQGQVCGNLSRLIIHRSVADELLEKLKKRLNDFSIGDPRVSTNCMGPVISAKKVSEIKAQIHKAETQGGRVLNFVNTLNISDDCREGFYISPVIIQGDHNLDIFKEEVFGPILCVQTFESLFEAVKLANATKYGLTASIWSRDIEKINYLTKHVISGKIWINSSHIYYPHTKFGGVKQSGNSNEMHKISLTEYQYIKNIIQPY